MQRMKTDSNAKKIQVAQAAHSNLDFLGLDTFQLHLRCDQNLIISIYRVWCPINQPINYGKVSMIFVETPLIWKLFLESIILSSWKSLGLSAIRWGTFFRTFGGRSFWRIIVTRPVVWGVITGVEWTDKPTQLQMWCHIMIWSWVVDQHNLQTHMLCYRLFITIFIVIVIINSIVIHHDHHSQRCYHSGHLHFCLSHGVAWCAHIVRSNPWFISCLLKRRSLPRISWFKDIWTCWSIVVMLLGLAHCCCCCCNCCCCCCCGCCGRRRRRRRRRRCCCCCYCCFIMILSTFLFQNWSTRTRINGILTLLVTWHACGTTNNFVGPRIYDPGSRFATTPPPLKSGTSVLPIGRDN